MRTDSQTVKAFQFLGQRLNVSPFIGKPFDGSAQGMARFRCQLAQILQHLFLHSYRNPTLRAFH